ncbi:MAG: hypothetical protein H0X38_07030 [Planctomycetes bacterium]|nr:hypothetical protein [Planctomycetota bacterium]
MRFAHLAALLILTACLACAAPVPEVAFLTPEQAKVAIIDESVEPYFSLLQTQEMSAKTGSVIEGATLQAQRDACRRRYQAAVGEFSATEQAAVQHAIAGVQPFLTAHYPVFAAEPWRFIKLARTFEGGMPHTRGHCIVLSDDVLPMFIAGAAQPTAAEGIMMLVHEQTHVLQRLHPQLFLPLYVESWGLTRMPGAPPATGELAKHQLVNPDGIACVWAYPVRKEGVTMLIQPQVLLGGDQPVPRMPADFSVVGLAVEKRGKAYDYLRKADGGLLLLAPLESLSDYGEAFAPSQENFHPNEICAELFSLMVTLDLLQRHEDESACQKGLRGWAASYLGSTAANASHAPLPRMDPPPQK